MEPDLRVQLVIPVNPDLQEKAWFGGGMSRDAAWAAVMGHPDGTFLLRTSTRHDSYSLSVKHLGKCIHLKVLVDEAGKCGFTKPCKYATIAAFVEEFQAVPLRL